MKLDDLFNNIEKILRYLVPAFVLTILLRYFEAENYEKYFSKTDGMEFAFYFMLAGVTVYSMHRVVFEIIDFILFRLNKKISEPGSVSEYISACCKMNDETKSYLYYKLATIHSALLTTELAIIFLLHEGLLKHKCLTTISSVLFVVSFIVYCKYHNIQREIVESLPSNIN